MTSLGDRKQKFMEHLTTLGALFAVFLGFVAGEASVLLTYTICVEVLFIISALFSYTSTLFEDTLKDRSKWVRSAAHFANTMLAVTFAALISSGVAIAFILTFPSASNWLVGAVVIVALLIAFFGVYSLILKVLGLEEPETEQSATSDNTFAQRWTG
jgi:MFS family permease